STRHLRITDESHPAMALGKHVADVLLLEPSDLSVEPGVLHRAGTCKCHWSGLYKLAAEDLLVRPWMGYRLRSLRPRPQAGRPRSRNSDCARPEQCVESHSSVAVVTSI